METGPQAAVGIMGRSEIIEHLLSHLNELRLGYYDFLGQKHVSQQIKDFEDQLDFFSDPDLTGNMSAEALEARFFAVINEANDRLSLPR